MLRLQDMCAGRNIPACAGKTLRYYRARYGNEEHPRVRGENPICGLSPRPI